MRPSLADDQRVARHLSGFVDLQQIKHRRRDIGEAAVSEMRARRSIDQHCRHDADRMLRMGLVRRRIAHHFKIAVVGADQHRAAGLL